MGHPKNAGKDTAVITGASGDAVIAVFSVPIRHRDVTTHTVLNWKGRPKIRERKARGAFWYLHRDEITKGWLSYEEFYREFYSYYYNYYRQFR